MGSRRCIGSRRPGEGGGDVYAARVGDGGLCGRVLDVCMILRSVVGGEMGVLFPQLEMDNRF